MEAVCPQFPGYYGTWDNPTWTFGDPAFPEIANPVSVDAASATTQVVPTASNPGCVSWGAVIVRTTVNEPDGDGLLDVWKTKQGYCDASINGGVCLQGFNSDPAGSPFLEQYSGARRICSFNSIICAARRPGLTPVLQEMVRIIPSIRDCLALPP